MKANSHQGIDSLISQVDNMSLAEKRTATDGGDADASSDSKENNKDVATTGSGSGDQSVYIKSVKEQAKKLNRLNTASELRSQSSHASSKKNAKFYYNASSVPPPPFREKTNTQPKVSAQSHFVSSIDRT